MWMQHEIDSLKQKNTRDKMLHDVNKMLQSIRLNWYPTEKKSRWN